MCQVSCAKILVCDNLSTVQRAESAEHVDGAITWREVAPRRAKRAGALGEGATDSKSSDQPRWLASRANRLGPALPVGRVTGDRADVGEVLELAVAAIEADGDALQSQLDDVAASAR